MRWEQSLVGLKVLCPGYSSCELAFLIFPMLALAARCSWSDREAREKDWYSVDTGMIFFFGREAQDSPAPHCPT